MTRVSDSHESSTSTCSDGTVRRTYYCNCGVLSPLRTSWTPDNMGRRFYGCGQYQGRERKCGFFKWHDPPMNTRQNVMISGLLKQIEVFKKKKIFLVRCFGLCVVVIVLLIIVIAIMVIKA
ncbi:uncharacterized protein LOC130731737 [Lotus japonicus]|uniref:uncharacterized protein LOC130731737 n=1 Tax=Lotus japonicus TaxID=34305 RepID=UPI002589A614|nr:uncharacterized protein LOC130731737 [Lotus japonicus]